MECQSNDPPPSYTCLKSPAGATLDRLSRGTKRGNFCFLPSGRGDIDDRIREVPVNVECDPREHCGLSVNSPKCLEEPGMYTISEQFARVDKKTDSWIDNVKPKF